MAEIQMKNIVKRYGDGFPAVNDVSIDVDDGEFLILVGPSGCGKSTLLRMIVGLEDITSGDMVIGGDRVNDIAPRDRNLAMVFQNYALYPHLTVYENIAFPLRLSKKFSDEEIDAKVREASKTLELDEHLERKPGNLSGGQRQRVAMGRAIVRDAKAFLFDEPLSNLDAKLRGQMRTEISRLQKRMGITTVYVTHDQTEAMTLGDRVAVLSGAILQQLATPRELYEQPVNLFVAGFIGSPPMNFMPATVKGDKVELPFATVDLPEHVRDGRIPEDTLHRRHPARVLRGRDRARRRQGRRRDVPGEDRRGRVAGQRGSSATSRTTRRRRWSPSWWSWRGSSTRRRCGRQIIVALDSVQPIQDGDEAELTSTPAGCTCSSPARART